MICEAKSGHPGGSLSATDILTALYFSEMNIDPANPKMAGRDRFVLSKGHAAPALYATLAERGYFDKDILKTLRQYQGLKIQYSFLLLIINLNHSAIRKLEKLSIWQWIKML